jgi:hypothetical protein
MWNWIIERYSDSALSIPTDKLVALSGIARAIHNRTRDQYAAGMWRKTLEVDLCWSAAHHTLQMDRSKFRKSRTYIAPSWSWASLNVQIACGSYNVRGNNYVPLIAILELDIRLAGKDPFGQLAGARLRLSCSMLLQVTMVLGSSDTGVYMIFGDEEVGPFWHIIYEADDGDCVYYTWDDINKCHAQDNREEINEEAHTNQKKGHKVYALPILKTEGRTNGLLLKAVDGERGAYKRVGSFAIELEPFRDPAKIQCPHSPDAYVDVLKDDSDITGYVIDLV